LLDPIPKVAMDCPEFLHRYSEYRDDEAETHPDRGAFLAHLTTCSSCHRYHAVLSRGVALMKGAQEPEFRDDFRERLQHRLYLAEFEDRRRSRFRASGPLSLGLAAAAVLAVVAVGSALAEAFAPTPALVLPPITAELPAAASGGRAGTPLPSRANRTVSPLEHPNYWGEAHTLLYEYSPIYTRNRSGGMVRTGIQ
jgi:anti-sigma factor RsiW